MESIVKEETRQDVMECISTDHAMVSMSIRLKVIKNKETKILKRLLVRVAAPSRAALRVLGSWGTLFVGLHSKIVL